MFCSFAADQRTAGLHAALSNAADDRSDLFRDVFAAGNVIQEEHRCSARADNVIYAHGNAVNADCIVLVQQERQLDLCSDAICPGDQDRMFHAGKTR